MLILFFLLFINISFVGELTTLTMERYRITIADDDPDDYLIIREIFSELRYCHDMNHVKDGTQLLYNLEKTVKSGMPLPDVILLDINMPKMNGIETLAKLKSSPALSAIPVLIYSTSSCVEQMRQCYMLGANGCVTKSGSISSIMSFVSSVCEFLDSLQVFPGSTFQLKPTYNSYQSVTIKNT